jgi:hypothetical protein
VNFKKAPSDRKSVTTKRFSAAAVLPLNKSVETTGRQWPREKIEILSFGTEFNSK